MEIVMRNTQLVRRIVLSASLVLSATSLAAQGKGKGSGNDKNKDKDHGRGSEARGAVIRGSDRSNHGDQDVKGSARGPRREARSDQKIERKFEREMAGEVALLREKDEKARGKFLRAVTLGELRPSVRRFFADDRGPSRIAAGAVARAQLRGLDDDVLVITPVDGRVRILNRSGLVLVDLDDDRARSLGRWDVVPVGERVSEGAPSFCRSGEGHPVFGRQWCLDKGFGLGGDDDRRWARTTRLDDIIFLQPTRTGSLTRDALIGVLGPIAFDRLALHAITLGLVEPLGGRWIGDDTGPRVLRLSSGDWPVAEIVDTNRDNRAETMVVALRRW
jgi:hypothetical protein